MINNNSIIDRHVFFVHGGVATEDREKVREITESENNAIIVASYGTFSTGINIKNLHNIIFASPSKSRKRIKVYNEEKFNYDIVNIPLKK